ncbi:hypothetical protein OIU84_028193 [Salix udensis]|uniref:Peptidase C14 caspase domain-containing protein n=1 Tax=Salix udensis TaxID=889485 RepID=A0AAD6P8Q5_9ROSI|nr:hypothetical protein OIU84_028193 [Salix udensis]
MASSKNPDSLNKKPSPLEISGSSSETRPAGKRALLIGVIYKSEHKLKGTINDVKSIREFLILNCGFKEDNILVLTDQEIEPELIPTKEKHPGIPGMAREGLSGSQPDFDGDERDGISETICPVDFMTEGMIVDNDINSAIVWPLKNGVTLHAIVDACHSGTVLDLEHVYNRQENKWEDNSPPSGNARKHSDGGLAISLSACLDNQVAADTTAFTEKTMNGAMTYLLIKFLKKYQGLTYGDLLDLMHEELEKVNESRCFCREIFKKFMKRMLLQRPQISASKPFDVYKEHLIL